MRQLLSLENAQAAILERVEPLPSVRVALAEAAGLVLEEDALASVDLPPFASSAMDGFALRAADAPASLPVVGAVAAGRPAERALAPGEAMSIATGGALPAGSDAVVPIEHVVIRDNSIEIPTDVAHGANVRPRGGDVRAGDVVLAAGSAVTPGRLGALAAAGAAEVICRRRPHVRVLATGSELRLPGEPLAPGQIYEANSLMLLAALEAAGATAERRAGVADEESAHAEGLGWALDADVVVTSGGVSVGPHDLVRRVAGSLGVEEVFWGVAVKPGKPVAFAVRGRTLVFGLPGNPVSALVSFALFVRPAVRALLGDRDPLPAFGRGRLAVSVRCDARRDSFLRARARAGNADGVVELEPLGGQDSHMIVRAAAADALVFVPRGDGDLPAGEAVAYLPLA